MTSPPKLKIILAIDPFELRFPLFEKGRIDIPSWLEEGRSTIEVVYVRAPSPHSGNDAEDHKRAYDRLDGRLRELGLSKTERRVIPDRHGGRFGRVRTLIEHAKERGCDLILVASKGRRWMGRLLFGSFAEALLLHSPVPVFFLRKTKPFFPEPGSGRRMMFPTDFSPASREAFRIFLRQVASETPEVLILHVEQYPGVITGYSLTGVGAYLPEVYWKIQKEASVSEGESWVREAGRLGVRARFLLEECGGDPAETVLRTAARSGISMIGLCTARSELDRLVLGSVSTRIFRSSRFHVWVLGPHGLETLKTRSAAIESVPPPPL